MELTWTLVSPHKVLSLPLVQEEEEESEKMSAKAKLLLQGLQEAVQSHFRGGIGALRAESLLNLGLWSRRMELESCFHLQEGQHLVDCCWACS